MGHVFRSQHEARYVFAFSNNSTQTCDLLYSSFISKGTHCICHLYTGFSVLVPRYKMMGFDNGLVVLCYKYATK